MKKLLLCSLMVLAGCTSLQENTSSPDSPEGLYLMGYKEFKQTDYPKAIENFDQVEQLFPYSSWAERAQIMMAYSYYLQNDFTDALLALDRFLQLHPGNRNVPYAIYLKALCYFEQMSDPLREQQMSVEADKTFRELLMRFPNSIYVNDAKEKLIAIKNHLAAKELAVGRYYQKNEDYIAAMNRFQSAINGWPDSNQVPEAYYRLAVCYKALGMTKQMGQVRQKLKEKFPESVWTKRADKI